MTSTCSAPPYSAVNFAAKYALFTEQWTPKVVAEMNDYQFKVVKIQGDFHLALSRGYRRDFHHSGRRIAH